MNEKEIEFINKVLPICLTMSSCRNQEDKKDIVGVRFIKHDGGYRIEVKYKYHKKNKDANKQVPDDLLNIYYDSYWFDTHGALINTNYGVYDSDEKQNKGQKRDKDSEKGI